MKIYFQLEKHCIETEAKKRYKRLISRYLSSTCHDDEKVKIETQVEALKHFLEHADFPQIRGLYPELSGDTASSVMLKIDGNFNDMQIVCNDNIIKPEWKLPKWE